MNFFGMGFTEILFVLIVTLIVMGPAKMVEIAQTMGKYAREFRRATSDLPQVLIDEVEDRDENQMPRGRTQSPESGKPIDENETTTDVGDTPVARG